MNIFKIIIINRFTFLLVYYQWGNVYLDECTLNNHSVNELLIVIDTIFGDNWCQPSSPFNAHSFTPWYYVHTTLAVKTRPRLRSPVVSIFIQQNQPFDRSSCYLVKIMSYRYVYGDLLSRTDVDAICHQVNIVSQLKHMVYH